MVELRLDPRLGARVAPSDVLQQAYVDCLTRYEHFFNRQGASFYVWLRLVVNQSLVDLHRRHLAAKMRDAGQEASPNWTAATSVSLARHLVAQMESPSQIVRKEEMLTQVQAALETLEPLDREILTLRHFEELGNNEVAELLGLAKAAASNRYVRALGRLRQALAKVPGFFLGRQSRLERLSQTRPAPVVVGRRPRVSANKRVSQVRFADLEKKGAEPAFQTRALEESGQDFLSSVGVISPRGHFKSGCAAGHGYATVINSQQGKFIPVQKMPCRFAAFAVNCEGIPFIRTLSLSGVPI